MLTGGRQALPVDATEGRESTVSSTRLTTTHIHRALHELLTAAPQRTDDGHPEFPLLCTTAARPV